MAKVCKRGNAWQIDYTDPQGKRIRISFEKKKEAEAELGKRVSLIAEGRDLDVKKDYKTTLGELSKLEGFLLGKLQDPFRRADFAGKH